VIQPGAGWGAWRVAAVSWGMRSFLGLSGVLLIAACGGTVTAPFGESSGAGASGGSSTTSGGDGGSSNTTGTDTTGTDTTTTTGTDVTATSASAGGGGDPGCVPAMGDCKTQTQDLRQKLGAAKACDPDLTNQCQGTVQGPCCLEAVNDPSSPEVQCFIETLAASTCMLGCDEPCAPVQGECVDKGEGPAHCI
jgi:hypothetical protein